MTRASKAHPAYVTVVLIAAGLAMGGAIGFASGARPEVAVLAAAGLGLAAALPVLIWAGVRVEHLVLFALMATLSLSLKFHPVFRADHVGGAVGLRISLTDLLMLALAVLAWWTAKGPIRVEAPRSFVRPFAVWVAAGLVSTVAGSDPELGLYEISAMLQGGALFVFLSNYINSPGRMRVACAGLVCGLAMQSLVAGAQWAVPGSFEFTALGSQAQGEIVVTDLAEIDLPAVDLGQTLLGGEVLARPMGMLIHANLLAVFLVTQVLLAVSIAQSHASSWLRRTAAAASAIGLFALYVTFSRTGWAVAVIGFTAGLAMAWRWDAIRLRPVDRLVVALASLAGLAILIRVAPVVWLRVTETAGDAWAFRTDLAMAAVRMWADAPLTGVGLNTFVQHVADYDASGMSAIRAFPVHNIFLLELSESGTVAALAFCAVVWFTLRESWRRARACRSAHARLFGAALVAGIAAFWTADLLAFSFRIPVMAGVLWSLVALAIANERTDTAAAEA